MAFRRRRRKPRLSWMPIRGTPFTVDQDTTSTTLVTFNLPVTKSILFTEFPITFDFGQEATQVQALAPPVVGGFTLADMVSSGWRLRRIVGGVYAAFTPTGSGALDVPVDQPAGAAFTVGFMVRNVDQTGSPSALQYVDVLNADDASDPWIWRRTWILGQGERMSRSAIPASALQDTRPVGGAISDGNAGFAKFPWTNAEYGDIRSGTHVDAKTNRIIGPEQSLFIHFATKGLAIQTANAVDGNIVGVYDLRLLGSLHRATNRRNAAR